MKQLSALITLFFILSCGNKSETSFKKSPTDTIKTLAIYSKGKDGIAYDVVYRIGVDSLMFVDMDSTTKKKKWSRYYKYFIPINDTARNEKGIPQKDSLGKYQSGIRYYPFYPGAIIKDVNINIDSLVKNYKPNF